LKYWDSSALIPLLVEEPSSSSIRAVLQEKSSIVSWWGTPVECLSALWRRKREGRLDNLSFLRVRERFDRLMEEIDLVAPTSAVRERTFRFLGLHHLTSADALQLASALRWSHDETKGVGFVCLDERLRSAALMQGFRVLP